MVKNKKLFFFASFGAIILAFLDLFTKQLVFRILETAPQGQIEVTSFFNLVTVLNRGVSFGMFADSAYSPIFFSIIVALITLIMLIWLYRNEKPYLAVAISLIIGGALGNLTDRIQNGAVADFLDFHLFGYHWPAFNLADSIVFIGVAMLIFEDLFTKNAKK